MWPSHKTPQVLQPGGTHVGRKDWLEDTTRPLNNSKAPRNRLRYLDAPAARLIGISRTNA